MENIASEDIRNSNVWSNDIRKSNVCSDDGQNQTFGVNTFAI